MDGKKFEALIKDSCELQGIDVTRLRDAGFTGVKESKRFTIRNICDFILFDGANMVFIEAKVRKQSLRFDELKQREMMEKKLKTAGPVGAKVGFLVLFPPDSLFWVPVQNIDSIERAVQKKSFNAKDCESLYALIKKIPMYKPERKRNKRIDMTEVMAD